MKYLNRVIGYRLSLLFFILGIILAFNFQTNFFQIVETYRFDNFQLDSEALSVGRMVKSQREGILSAGGLNGRLLHTDKRLRKYNPYYIKSKSIGNDGFEPYFSQNGFQSMIYVSIVNLFKISVPDAILYFQYLNSFLTAAMLMFFCYWSYSHFGLVAMMFTYSMIFISNWIILFSRNIYWVSWIFLLPFILGLFFIRSYTKSHNLTYKTIFFFFLSIFLCKCLLNGFEYISAVSISSLLPLLFYAILERWSIKHLIKRTMTAITGMITAMLCSLTILAFQLKILKGGFSDALGSILFSFNKRAFGNQDKLPEIYKKSVNSSLFEVLGNYWQGDVFDFSNFITWHCLQSITHISMGTILIILSLLSFSPFIFSTTLKAEKTYRLYISLITSMWVSLICPLSWFVIFKGHSYLHLHINFIVWYIPFLLIAFTFFGYTLSLLFKFLSCKLGSIEIVR